MPSHVHVAVGVIVGAHGKILIARRSKNQHQGGLWEFPGGKVERGESVVAALARELREELGICIRSPSPLLKVSHDYADKSVVLDIWRVPSYRGAAVGREGQPLRWVDASALRDYGFPEANRCIVAALSLPSIMGITGQYEGEADFLGRLGRMLNTGVGLVYLRQAQNFQLGLFARAVEVCRQAGAMVVTNHRSLAQEYCVGLHLTREHLDAATQESVAAFGVVGAACHSDADLRKAKLLNLSYAVLSPVRRTQTHKQAVPLGVEAFAQSARLAGLPVYGLGGLEPKDAPVFRALGAQGVACISALWGGPVEAAVKIL